MIETMARNENFFVQANHGLDVCDNFYSQSWNQDYLMGYKCYITACTKVLRQNVYCRSMWNAFHSLHKQMLLSLVIYIILSSMHKTVTILLWIIISKSTTKHIVRRFVCIWNRTSSTAPVGDPSDYR